MTGFLRSCPQRDKEMLKHNIASLMEQFGLSNGDIFQILQDILNDLKSGDKIYVKQDKSRTLDR